MRFLARYAALNFFFLLSRFSLQDASDLYCIYLFAANSLIA